MVRFFCSTEGSILCAVGVFCMALAPADTDGRGQRELALERTRAGVDARIAKGKT